MSIISVVTQSPIWLFIGKSGFKLNKKFREKFGLEFQVYLYILYIFTSPSAENKDKFVHLGRLFLPSCPVGYSLKRDDNKFIYSTFCNAEEWGKKCNYLHILLFYYLLLQF